MTSRDLGGLEGQGPDPTHLRLNISSRQQYKPQQWGRYRVPQNILLYVFRTLH